MLFLAYSQFDDHIAARLFPLLGAIQPSLVQKRLFRSQVVPLISALFRRARAHNTLASSRPSRTPYLVVVLKFQGPVVTPNNVIFTSQQAVPRTRLARTLVLYVSHRMYNVCFAPPRPPLSQFCPLAPCRL